MRFHFAVITVRSKLNEFPGIASNLAYRKYVYETHLRHKGKYKVPRSDSIREYRAKNISLDTFVGWAYLRGIAGIKIHAMSRFLMTRKRLIVAYVRNGGNEPGITCDSTVLARFFARMYIAAYQRHRGERGRRGDMRERMKKDRGARKCRM